MFPLFSSGFGYDHTQTHGLSPGTVSACLRGATKVRQGFPGMRPLSVRFCTIGDLEIG
ncbi:hypothetical protein DPMN_039053 [Dreissena polymorpha]|uniref:Uncharacterized protein n=1 Tax=Dreissena polymorpha TaxID=45954 RepID=A0A9D4RNU1_DREPO|nr:hypothetical protein DPMN_039053 [Dreissena polymorpha]